MTERRFTMYGDMANIKQWILDKKDNSRMSSKWEMLDKLNELAKENERLKKESKRCKDWINSDKNDYELILAFIKNKGYSLKDVLEYEKELKNKG